MKGTVKRLAGQRRHYNHYGRLQAHGLTMPDAPSNLRPMSGFNPSEPGILHDRAPTQSRPGPERMKPNTERMP